MVSYNIANGCEGDDCNGSSGQDDVIGANMSAAVDVVALQEVCDYHLGELRASLGPEFSVLTGWDADPSVGGACGQPTRSFGNALFVRRDVGASWSTSTFFFSQNDSRPCEPNEKNCDPAYGKVKNRNVACVHTTTRSVPVLACNTHLAADPGRAIAL
ncbi:MAG: hypothetical protein KF703_06535, partial [Actinobacteria bacterium]|nr:hypothetical protein [Actinomycetota bacterium]